MKRVPLLLLVVPLLAFGQALTQVGQVSQCPYADPRGCAMASVPVSLVPLLSFLPGGPTSAQMAAGSLTTVAGVSVTATRASSVYAANSSGVLTSLSSNQPAVDGAFPTAGLRAEAAATQLLGQTNTFTNALWSLDGTSIAQSVTGPDGQSNTGWTISNGSAGGNHRLYQANNQTAQNAYSFYAKAGTSNFIGLSGFNTCNGVWNVSAGSVFANSGGTASIQAIGSGWYRCVLICTNTGAGNYIISIGDTGAHATGPNNSYRGPSTNVLLAFSQQETGGFASSYIPATNVSVTRAVDDSRVTNPLAAAGTTYCVGETITPQNTSWSGTQGILAAGTAAAANTWSLSLTSAGKPTFSVYDSSAAQKVYTATSAISVARHRVQACNTAGTLTVNVDGSTAAGATTGAGNATTTAQPATILIGETAMGGTNILGGWVTDGCADPSAVKCPP